MIGDVPRDLAEFYPAAYRRLVGTLCVLGVPREDALDVAQDAFVRLVPRWATVRDYDNVDAWLRTVGWRLWQKRKRRKRGGVLTEHAVDRPVPGLHPPDHDLHRAIRSLPGGNGKSWPCTTCSICPFTRSPASSPFPSAPSNHA